MKKTKIIGTIGPASESYNILKEMFLSGLDVVRINLSHSNHEEATELVRLIRDLNCELNRSVGILFDTKGPEIRVGDLEEDINVFKGDTVTFTNRDTFGTNKVFIDYCNLYNDVNVGDRILLEDGLLEFRVSKVDGEDIVCTAFSNGVIKGNKGLNAPDTVLNIDFLSVIDKDDIMFASKVGADFIALSFVRDANDVLDVNDMLIGLKDEHMQIISKIESKSAVDNIENIIKVSDGVMIARGDLGVEVNLEEVPSIQKRIVKECFSKGKICIVATEMLSSMEEKLRPTRAEVSDVANAVLDGVDAVMLSGETAIGINPVAAITTMGKIIESTEAMIDYDELLTRCNKNRTSDIPTVISHSVVDAANMVNASVIVAATITGYTARKVSSFRPSCFIIATTPREKTATSMSLNWGIVPVLVDNLSSTDEIVEVAIKISKNMFNLKSKDRLVITGGFPSKYTKYTNFLKIEEIE